MRSRVAQYMNEIISLSIMALLVVALVAQQAGAGMRAGATPAEPEAPALVIEVDFSFRHNGE